MSNSFKNSNSPADRFRNSRGLDVPVDTFLYACLEAEQTIKALSADQKRPIQWPNLQDLSEEDLKSEFEAQQLQDIFEDLLSWYSANYPDLSTNLAWDYGVVSLVVQPLVCLAYDLNSVHQIKLGERLPEFDQDAEVNHTVWALIKSLVGRFFSSKSNYITRYIEWSFGKARELDGDAASRPPVGRFSPHAQRQRSQRESRDRHTASAGAPQRDVNGNNHHHHQGGGHGGQQGRGRPAGRGGGGGDRGRGNDHRHRGGPRRPPQETNAEMEAAAIQACNEAFAHLEANPNEEKVILKPQNSFYRRIQHQVIVSNNFHSESIGEGHDRAVAVWRKT
jgi:hypothetical protein